MLKLNAFINRYYRIALLCLTLAIFLNTCGNPNKSTNKRLDALVVQIDSLKGVVATGKDLQIEGLKSEKRMIQATDRRMLDVQRQTAIDAEIKKIEE